LTGGPNADRFVLADAAHSTAALPDQILDFTRTAGDLIDLSGIDAIAGGADDPFSFLAGGAFDSTAGRVISISLGGGLYRVEGDIDGNNIADFAIVVTSPLALGAGAFIL
jgi:Ca2+-binding RTX toxin-like protein